MTPLEVFITFNYWIVNKQDKFSAPIYVFSLYACIRETK